MNFTRIFDILPYQKGRYPKKKALTFKENKKWKAFSTEESIEQIDNISNGLLKKGVRKGDKVILIALSGSPLWNFFDMAIMQIGAIPVPVHASVTSEVLQYILNDSGAKYCFAFDKELYDKVKAVKKEVSALKHILLLSKNDSGIFINEFSIAPNKEEREIIEQAKAGISEEDLATIIYTSGTTGSPKGVMLSHKNIISNIKSIIALIPVNYKNTVFSYLPLSHIFERMVTYTYMAVGASLYYSDDLSTAFQEIREVRPDYFTSVPRILEKFYENILGEIQKKNFFLRKILLWAIKQGEKFDKRKKNNPLALIKIFIARFLIFRKWRKVLGNRVKGIFVGAAALQPKIGRLFSAAGIKVREGYGLTETSPIVSFNRFEPGGVRFGTVGIPIPGVAVKIDNPNEKGEGEIMVKGYNVMPGYYNKPEETEKVLTKDGWFHTGDAGKFVHKKFLKITGRKKDAFKTTHGKYVTPQGIEKRLKDSPFINQCLVLGAHRPFVTAIIIPSFPVLQNWCKENNIHWTAPQFMVINTKVEKHYYRIIEKINENLESHEKIRKLLILHKEWTVETGDITPTLKLKRFKILGDNEKEIGKIYNMK